MLGRTVGSVNVWIHTPIDMGAGLLRMPAEALDFMAIFVS